MSDRIQRSLTIGLCCLHWRLNIIAAVEHAEYVKRGCAKGVVALRTVFFFIICIAVHGNTAPPILEGSAGMREATFSTLGPTNREFCPVISYHAFWIHQCVTGLLHTRDGDKLSLSFSPLVVGVGQVRLFIQIRWNESVTIAQKIKRPSSLQKTRWLNLDDGTCARLLIELVESKETKRWRFHIHFKV